MLLQYGLNLMVPGFVSPEPSCCRAGGRPFRGQREERLSLSFPLAEAWWKWRATAPSSSQRPSPRESRESGGRGESVLGARSGTLGECLKRESFEGHSLPLLAVFLFFSEDALAVAPGSSRRGGHVRAAGQQGQRGLHHPPGRQKAAPKQGSAPPRQRPSSQDLLIPVFLISEARSQETAPIAPIDSVAGPCWAKAFFFLAWMLWTGRGLEDAREEGLLFPAAWLSCRGSP